MGKDVESNEHEECAHKKAIKDLQSAANCFKDRPMAGFLELHGKLSVAPARKDVIRDVDLSRLDRHIRCVSAQEL